jgi:CelD/BcsL family acetyltransferase involved in cellulose biosynthesis
MEAGAMTVAFRDTGSRPLPVALPSAVPAIQVTVHDDLQAAAPAWQALAAGDAVASPYQSYDWIGLWHRHVSGPCGDEPLIAVGSDDAGVPLFVWPLVMRRLGRLRVASFFGGKHATLNMPLWRRDGAAHIDAAMLRTAIAEIGHQRPALDLILLHNQPAVWNGVPNPFMALPHQRSSEDNFVLEIASSAERIIETQISGTMRGRLRNKERKLAKLKGYRYRRATTVQDVERQLSAFFSQKATKLRAIGVKDVFAEPGIENFIRAACLTGLDSGKPLIELHALETDNDMLALFSGIHDGWRFTSMFNSHTTSDHNRFSPGLILLQYLIRECAARGFSSFDIGPGEARYKTFFCKTLEPIYDSVLPVSPRGQLAAPAIRAARWGKSTIKRNPSLWRIAHAIRASRLSGKSAD